MSYFNSYILKQKLNIQRYFQKINLYVQKYLSNVQYIHANYQFNSLYIYQLDEDALHFNSHQYVKHKMKN